MLPWFGPPPPHLGLRDSAFRNSPTPLPPTTQQSRGLLLVIPERISFEDWAASLLIDMPQDDVPALLDPHDWRSWANALYNCPSVARVLPPDPSGFDSWRPWAFQFYYFMSGQQPPQS